MGEVLQFENISIQKLSLLVCILHIVKTGGKTWGWNNNHKEDI